MNSNLRSKTMTTKKINKNQLLETIRDTIYEVLEEEVDRMLKSKKQEKISEKTAKKAKAAKAINEAKKRRARKIEAIKSIREKRAKLAEANRKLARRERSLRK
jgi:hypothetical protein